MRHAFFGWLLALGIVGCGGASQAPATPAAAQAVALKAPGEARVGDRTKCPVSGEEFTVAADSPKTEWKGKTYYFCCQGCDATFAKDPEKYVGAR